MEIAVFLEVFGFQQALHMSESALQLLNIGYAPLDIVITGLGR